LRLVETRDASFKMIEARSIEPRVFDAIVASEREEEPEIVSVYGPTKAMFLDLPLLRGDEAPQTGYVAASANPWPGTVAFYRSPSTSGYELNTLAGAQAVNGISLFDFYSGPLYRFDRSNDLYVKLASGTASSPRALLKARITRLANADGAWELLQFQTAELIDTSTYKLSDLLRGQGGTESAMRNPLAAGARFVLINSAVTAVNLRPDEVGLALNYKFGPVSETLDDLSYGSASHAFQGLGLRPLRPVHLQGKRDPSTGDWTLLWIRRTRMGGDSWEASVPLAENEAYRWLSTAAVWCGRWSRCVDISLPPRESPIQLDPVERLTIRVAQVSQVYGAGVAATELTYDDQH
jgi:hypothetical protein